MAVEPPSHLVPADSWLECDRPAAAHADDDYLGREVSWASEVVTCRTGGDVTRGLACPPLPLTLNAGRVAVHRGPFPTPNSFERKVRASWVAGSGQRNSFALTVVIGFRLDGRVSKVC